MTRPSDEAECEARRRVLAAKLRKARRGEHFDLTPRELDRVIPAAECARTRNREGRAIGR